MKVLLFISVTFVSLNFNMFLVVSPNEQGHSILIANKFKYNKIWKMPHNKAQGFP